MAKIYGLFGAMTGKTADVVMAVRNGEQIVRKYQPVVANPNTPAQIGARAKLKLLSQMSAVMASVIAMPRVGAVSSRNLFTKINYPSTSFAGNQADITLTAVQLTKSAVALPAVIAVRGEGNISAELRGAEVFGGVDVNRVVYCMFVKTSDNKLRFVESKVATESGQYQNWPVTFGDVSLEGVIYAYGVRDNTEAARVAFGNLSVASAETIAKLITSRNLTEADITLTETRAVLVPVAA